MGALNPFAREGAEMASEKNLSNEKAGGAAPGQEPRVLPLGTVLRLKGAKEPLMITARCMRVNTEHGPVVADYGGCPWPAGMVNDQVIYFDEPSIERVLAYGFANESEHEFQRRIAEARSASELPHLWDVQQHDTQGGEA